MQSEPELGPDPGRRVEIVGRIRIVHIDDDGLLRDSLQRAFSHSNESINIVAASGRARDVVPLILAHKPDVLLLDIKLPQEDGFIFGAEQALHWLAAHAPQTRVILLSGHIVREFVQRAQSEQVYGYMHKEEVSVPALTSAIKQVMTGRMVLSDKVRAEIRNQPRKKRGPTQGLLSDREREVAQALLELGDLSQEERARHLGIAIVTLKTHQEHIAEKLGVKNREHVIAAELYRLGMGPL